MCKLSGYYLTKPTTTAKKTAIKTVKNLVIYQQSGGSDATGLGFIDPKEPGKFWIYKDAKPADEFINRKQTTDLLKKQPRSLIAHCRLKTQGTADDNRNNHPNYTKAGTITIHNGIITNDRELFEKYKIDRDGQVDSEIIGKLIDYHRKNDKKTTTIKAIQSSIAEIRGSIACALLFAQEPNSLYLLHRDNELSIAIEKKTGIIYFATDKTALQNALYTYRYMLGFFAEVDNRDDFIIREVPIGYGLKISPENIQMFTLETPAYRADNYISKPYCYQHKCFFDDPLCTHTSQEAVKRDNYNYSYNSYSSYSRDIPKSEPKPTPEFDEKNIIVKPSKHCTDELERRKEYLETKEYSKPLTKPEEREIKMLENALDSRYLLPEYPKTDKPKQTKLIQL